MVKGILAIILAIAALSCIAFSPQIVASMPSVAAIIASVMVEITNIDRSQNGLAVLTINPTLGAVAEAKAHDMATKGYFAHTSPEGVTPWYWFKEGGYKFTYAGENLAVDFNESSSVVEAWMNSPTHRANLLGTQFTEIGIAVATGTYQGRPTTFVVQEFGTPIPAAQPPRARPVREVINAPAPTQTAVAVTAPQNVTPAEVLGSSVGAALATPQVPWWFKILHYFF